MSFLARDFPADAQMAFTERVIRDLGFDMEAGRQDRSAHPFTSGAGPYDVRLTTRIAQGDPRSSLMASIHEAGHGLYEQGIVGKKIERTFAGVAPSLGLHESQSRLWENQVGRSRAFWEHYYPAYRDTFPDALADVELEQWLRAVNFVEPSLIRVEADELTYNLHILIRFELEVALLRGDLAVADLPGAWNDAVPRDARRRGPARRRRRPPGHALVDRLVRLLPDVHARQPLLGAAVRGGQGRPR